MAEEKSSIEKIANAAFLVLISRLAAPLLIACCLWMGNKVSSMSENVAAALATLSGHDKRIENLEQWRNGFDAMADEGRHR